MLQAINSSTVNQYRHSSLSSLSARWERWDIVWTWSLFRSSVLSEQWFFFGTHNGLWFNREYVDLNCQEVDPRSIQNGRGRCFISWLPSHLIIRWSGGGGEKGDCVRTWRQRVHDHQVLRKYSSRNESTLQVIESCFTSSMIRVRSSAR